MKGNQRAALAAIVGVGFALALAGCAAPPSVPAASSTAAAQRRRFAQVGGAQFAYAEFKNSAFPYHGDIPGDVRALEGASRSSTSNENGRLGHTSPRGGVLWEDKTYNDRHVLLAASTDFNPNAPGVDRRLLPRQQRDARARRGRAAADARGSSRRLKLNAVLVAPQMAVDARDSSAGNFWRAGAFAHFLDEADAKLAALYPQALARRIPRACRSIIVAYSGGYLPAAYSLALRRRGRPRHAASCCSTRSMASPTSSRAGSSRSAATRSSSAPIPRSSKDGNARDAGAAGARRRPYRDRPAADAAPRRRRLRRRRRRQPRRFRQARLDQRSASPTC